MHNISHIAKLINSYFSNQKVPHAFLFKANPKINMDNDLIYLINKLNDWQLTNFDQRLPYDLILLDSNKMSIDKEVLDKAIYQLSLSPLEAKNKILIIKNLENIHSSSLNALLKFIEEPFFNTYVILTTNLIDKILLTIKSRCQVLHVFEKKIINSTNLPVSQFDLLSSIVSDQKDFDNSIAIFAQYLKLLNEELKKALKNPYYLKLSLDSELTKENAFFMLNILQHLITLVLANDYQKDLFFSEKVFHKYFQSDIDFIKFLELINNFLKQINRNVNYFLVKETFLIKLVDTYGK